MLTEAQCNAIVKPVLDGADEMRRGLMNWRSEAEPKELTWILCILKIVLKLDLLSTEPCGAAADTDLLDLWP